MPGKESSTKKGESRKKKRSKPIKADPDRSEIERNLRHDFDGSGTKTWFTALVDQLFLCIAMHIYASLIYYVWGFAGIIASV